MNKLYLIHTCILLIFIHVLEAQTLDTTFRPQISKLGTIHVIKQQPDGKILVGGQFTEYQNVAVNNLIRLHPDGSPDMEFVNNIGSGPNREVRAIALQPNGKILIGGNFERFDGVAKNRLVRLDQNGNLDQNFIKELGEGFDRQIFCINTDFPTRIIIGGNFRALDGEQVEPIVAIDTFGRREVEFASSLKFNSNAFIQDMVKHTDNHLVLVGNFSIQQGSQQNVARIDFDGSLDTAFANTQVLGNTFQGTVITVDCDSLGRVIAGGFFRDFLKALLPDGTLDTSFARSGGPSFTVRKVKCQPSSDKILIGGDFSIYQSQPRQGLALLNANGSLDSTFVVGTGLDGSPNDILPLEDGRTYVGGAFKKYDDSFSNLPLLQDDGSLIDPLRFRQPAQITALTELPNRKIMIAGDMLFIGNDNVSGFTCLNADGSLNKKFQENVGTGFNALVREILGLEDGKVVLVGNFTSYNGEPAPYLACLDSLGRLHSSFMDNLGDGFDKRLSSLVLRTNAGQSSEILVSGQAKELDGTPVFRDPNSNAINHLGLFIINTEGEPLNINQGTFMPGFRGRETYAIDIQSDGSIIMGGDLEEFIDRSETQGLSNIVSLDASRRYKSSFNTSGSDGVIRHLRVLDDDDVLVAGDFRNFNGINKNHLVKIDARGGIDEDYKFSLQEESEVNGIELQDIGSEKKQILYGNFKGLSGNFRYLIRLNGDGTFDESFQVPFSLPDALTQVFVTAEQDLILAGKFTGTLVKLLTPPPPCLPTHLSARVDSLTGRGVRLSWTCEDTNAFFQIQRRTPASEFADLDLTSENQNTYLDTDVSPRILYQYRLKAINQGNTSSFTDTIGIIISPLITEVNPFGFNQLSVYPSPGSHELSLGFPSGFTNRKPTEILIRDAFGKIKYHKLFTNEENITINTEFLPSGMYYISIRNSQGQIDKKWIKLNSK